MRKLRLNATRFVVLVFTAALAIWAFQSAQFKQAANNPDYCIQCHEMGPKITPPGNLIIPHLNYT
ncbi:MAG: hypothetical protein M0021_11645 [Clostridia bacterium]|nr:hypothetical protein [Clostridia bacterium]